MFFVSDLTDCKNTSRIARNIAKLTTGRVSSKIKLKFCQYADTTEKSEKIKEKKLMNPVLLKSEMSVLKDGINANNDPVSVIEKIIIFLKTKRRSLPWMRFKIFSNNPCGGSI